MKILLVEDEVGITAFVKQGLEEEDYKVDVVHDGSAGLELALKGGYDLLLLDRMLPNIDGVSILQKFREQDQNTPVIFLTAKDTLDDTIEGLRSGANDYIKKPFHFNELLERVKVQLRSNEKHAIIKLSDIEINTDKLEVKKGGEIVALTQKEFDLLTYLVKNKGKVCSRTAILNDVWDIHFDYDSGVIDVFMNAIRRKLHLTPSNPYIQAVRGVGYIAKEE